MGGIHAAPNNFEDHLQHEHVHTTRTLIFLEKTNADLLVQGKHGEVVHPMPPISLRDCKELQQSQRCDIISLDSPQSRCQRLAW